MDVVVVKHYDLLGKIRELYVTSGFSSGTHNSCRLICLRFNPVKMSECRETFSILQCVGRILLVTIGVFELLGFWYWPAQIEDCPVKRNFNGSEFVASHMFLSATA